MSLPFPFPILWRVPLDWFFVYCQPPHGTFFLCRAGLFLTDFLRRPERLSGVVAVTEEGTCPWKLNLPAMMAPGAATVLGEYLFCVAMEPGKGGMLYRIDVVQGAREAVFPLLWGADGLIPLSENRLLVRNQIPEAGSPGLYAMDSDGNNAQPIAGDSTWRLERREDRILTVTRTGIDDPRGLHMFAAPSLDELWTAMTVNEAVAFDGERVYHVESQNGEQYLTARCAANGEIQWQTGPLSHPVVNIETGGTILLCGHLGGSQLYRCNDGSLLASLTGSYSHPIDDGDRLYIIGEEALLCARL
jgi:hypothetical protein